MSEVARPPRNPEAADDHAVATPAFLTDYPRQPLFDDFQNLLEQHNCAVITFAFDGKIQFWNQMAEAIFGYTASEMIGSSSMVLTPPECVDESKLWKRRVRAGEILLRNETTRLRKDGSRVQVSVSAYPLRDRRYEIVGTWSLIQELTERSPEPKATDNLPAKLAQVRDDERSRIARDLHDGTGQLLMVITSNLLMLTRIRPKFTDDRLDAILEDTLALVEEVAREIRINAYLLRPPALADRSLAEAMSSCLDDLAIRGGLQVESDLAADYGDLPNEVEVALFRIFQEGLSNILRHSKSSVAFVSLRRVNDRVVLVVRDWGVGFDPTQQGPGLGLGNMKERAGLVHGDLSVDSTPEGTTLRASVPCSSSNPS